MRSLVLAVALLAACYKDPHFGDCELTCSPAIGCPGGLSCLNGMCRTAGNTGACAMVAHDGAVDSPTDIMTIDGSAGDTDADGVANAVDNCPDKANTDQADEDGDTRGDVCDPCPIVGTAAADIDSDADGVGDGCDPFPTDTTTPDHLALFEGFAGSTSVGQMFGGGTWTFPGGVARVSNLGQAAAGLTWAVGMYMQETVTTQVTLNAAHGPPRFFGTLDRTDGAGGIGASCANHTDSVGVSGFVIADVSGGVINQVSAAYNAGQPYEIKEQFLNGTFQCKRVMDNLQVSGTDTAATGPRWGIVAGAVDATFDYVMVVAR